MNNPREAVHPQEEALQTHWAAGREIHKKLLDLGFERYVREVSLLPEAFRLRDRNLRCIDEGTPGGIHLAGSGILLDKKAATAIVGNAEVDGIWSHAECGAAALAAKLNSMDPSGTERYARKWAEDLAQAAGVPYLGHIEKLARPQKFHIARVAYYDATGVFDPENAPELPKGFVISRRWLEPEYAKKETDIAITIALGPHGFGGLITKDFPLILTAIGNPDEIHQSFSQAELKKELSSLVAPYDGRVIIDGFDAPLIK